MSSRGKDEEEKKDRSGERSRDLHVVEGSHENTTKSRRQTRAREARNKLDDEGKRQRQ
jgi:hypothetical protein